MRIKQHRSLPEAKTPIQNTTSRICNNQLTKKKLAIYYSVSVGVLTSWANNFISGLVSAKKNNYVNKREKGNTVERRWESK